jgi:hypothetical protein
LGSKQNRIPSRQIRMGTETRREGVANQVTTMGCKRDPGARRKPIPRVSKSPRRRKELREDTAWAHAVIDRAGNRCEKCGRIGTQAHHIVRRGNPTFRHSMLNGVALCPTHHAEAHAKPGAFREWLYLNRHERWCLIARRFER